MRKRIAVFLGEITGNFQQVVTKGITTRANALGYDVMIFCTYGSYNDDILYSEGERAGIYLPDYSSFDGIIVTEDVFDIEGMGDELYQNLRENANCPVVYLRTVREGHYSIVVENYESMKEMVRHFTDVHGFTDICYMSGKKGLLDAKERLKAFLDVMEEKGIRVTEHMIFHGDYWREKGEEAIEWFMEGRDRYPQAIICANDYMALSICDELRKRGVRIPEDVCVSGVDFVEEARHHDPTITSVEVDFGGMSARAVEVIDRVVNGEKLEQFHHMRAELRLHKSCGCGEQFALGDVAQMLEDNYQQTATMKNVMLSVMEYQDAIGEDEYLAVADKYRSIIKSDKAWICLCDTEEQGYSEVENDSVFSEQMILKRVFTGRKKTEKPELHFERRELLPKDAWSEDKPNNFLFFGIHFKNKVYGYMATEIPTAQWFDIYTQSYLMNLANAIENSSVQREMASLEEIKALYQRDSLTGLYNRRGYDKLLRDRFNQARETDGNFSVVSIDMDGLKYINDTFGHAEGDEALKKLAEALQSVMEDGEFCARVGGDEFAAVLCTSKPDRGEMFVKLLEEAIARINMDSKQYPMGASVGMCNLSEKPGAPLIAYLQTADMRMYENKRKRKEAAGK